MAKQKTIISNFGDLKGKVTFSDKKPVAKPLPQEMTSPQKSKEESILKIGQHVVLMDANLRGTIISLGKTVGIELEDGLTIDAAYGEFAVTDKKEMSTLRQSKAKPKKTISSVRSKTSSANSNMLTVDLHIDAIPDGKSIPKGQQLQFQIEIFRKIIRDNIHHRGLKISFIHGIGDGILKAAIRKELDEVLALRCSYNVGDPAVTVVYIK